MLKKIYTITASLMFSAILKPVAGNPFIPGSDVNGSFPTEAWGISDWTIGVVMGVYGPLASYSRDYDCFTAWYNFGLSTVELSNYFNKPFEYDRLADWMFFFLHSGFYGYEIFLSWDTCVRELAWNKDNPWRDNFGFLADLEIPFVRAMSTSELNWTILMSFKLALGLMWVIVYWQSRYYYWQLGMNMGRLAANIFVATDKWGEYGVITPTPARIRYLDN